MRRRFQLLVVAAVAATMAAGAPAYASTADGTVFVCTGTATWNIAPSGSAAFSIAGIVCTDGTGSAGPGITDTSVTTSTSLVNAFGTSVSYIPVVNTTAPVGAFAGVIPPQGNGTLAGTISGVNGVGLEVNVASELTTTTTPSTRVQYATFAGAFSCGSYCFNTVAVWGGVIVNA